MVASLLRLAAADYDDAVAIRAAELARVTELLARGGVVDEAIDLDAAWRALIALHAELEERDDEEATVVVDDIWRLIRDRVDRRERGARPDVTRRSGFRVSSPARSGRRTSSEPSVGGGGLLRLDELHRCGAAVQLALAGLGDEHLAARTSRT